jgi:diguanylate cyclase (GGDEF)-like protein
MDLADGTRRHLLASAAPFHGVDGGLFGIVEAFRDITERKQAEEAVRRANEELQRLATIDGLTQIANRRRFDEVLQIEWKRMSREQKPLSIILSDLDFFKLYNDTYGHLSGDDCLRAVARCVSDETKRPSDLAARYGGEEFVVLLPNTDSAGALQVAEGVLKRVAKMNIEHSCRSARDAESRRRHRHARLQNLTQCFSRHRRPGPLPGQETRPQSRHLPGGALNSSVFVVKMFVDQLPRSGLDGVPACRRQLLKHDRLFVDHHLGDPANAE